MVNGPSGSERARTTLAYLRRHIARGDWPVNSRIPTETELMELIGVGKTTVREAVRSLASLGMLETLPGRGTFVRSRTPVSSVVTDYLSDFELGDLLVFRRALEIEAAKQAAQRRTAEQVEALRAAHERDTPQDIDYPSRPPERPMPGRSPGQFHATLFDASGSRLLAALYGGVMASVRRGLDRGDLVYHEAAQLRHADHAAVLAAIEQQDVIGAARAMSTHVDRDLVPAESAENVVSVDNVDAVVSVDAVALADAVDAADATAPADSKDSAADAPR